MTEAIALALTLAAAPAPDGERAFRSRCAECHTVRALQRSLRKRPAAERAAYLAELGHTVIGVDSSEEMLERAAPLADRAVRLESGRIVQQGAPAEVVVDYPGAPTVTRLGRLLGWDPLPLTVRDAQVRARASSGVPRPK